MTDTCDTCGGPLYATPDAPAIGALVQRSPDGEYVREAWHLACLPPEFVAYYQFPDRWAAIVHLRRGPQAVTFTADGVTRRPLFAGHTTTVP